MSSHISPDALHEAWMAMRARAAFSGWPPTFDQVMADPVRCRLVQLEATGSARAPAPRTPSPACHPTRPVFPRAQPGFDRKRAAAGERDDD